MVWVLIYSDLVYRRFVSLKLVILIHSLFNIPLYRGSGHVSYLTGAKNLSHIYWVRVSMNSYRSKRFFFQRQYRSLASKTSSPKAHLMQRCNHLESDISYLVLVLQHRTYVMPDAVTIVTYGLALCCHEHNSNSELYLKFQCLKYDLTT